MSDPKPAHSTTPWIVAGVLVLVVAALTVLLVHTYSVRNDNKSQAGSSVQPTRDQLNAVQMGATEAANLTTLSRKNFSPPITLARSPGRPER